MLFVSMHVLECSRMQAELHVAAEGSPTCGAAITEQAKRTRIELGISGITAQVLIRVVGVLV
jgi:hypothetical protein